MRTPTRAAAGSDVVPVAVARSRRDARRTLAELKEFVRFPSISTDPKRSADVQRCAAWLAGLLRRAGMDGVQMVATSRHPIVMAEWRRLPGRPTVLVYGHYDVQPVDPLSEWQSPPFQPVVRGQDLHGRGASDDKGQLFAHVKALEAYLRTRGGPPVNVRCIFEGEEEIGSPNLGAFLMRNRRALASDIAVMSDTRMAGPGRPAITYALRGNLNAELEVRGPRRDLHSGTFGGAVHDPGRALCEIVARLHDGDGRVAVPGFYDRVRRLGPAERERLAHRGPGDERILADAGVLRGWGEPGFSLYERTTIRPALTVSGITAGYQGRGSKAVIPAAATAKLNLRLVPEQDPEEIGLLFRRHIASLTPPTVRARIRILGSAEPAVVDRNHPGIRAATFAYRKAFGVAPVFLRSGGTIPVVRLLERALGIPTVMMGLALPDDRAHAPNEKFHLPNLWRGIAASIWFLYRVGAGP